MAEPELVADCVTAMRDAVALPVTVKHRIGVDDGNDYGFVRDSSPRWPLGAATCSSCMRATPAEGALSPRKTARSRRCATTSCTD